MALKLGFEVEAWTLPGIGTFASVVTDIPAVTVKGIDQAIGLGSGSFTVPPDFAGLDSICNPDTDTETFIRLKVDGAYTQFGFFARDRQENYDDSGLVKISGPGPEEILNQAIAYAFDHPKFDLEGNLFSQQPDWDYGSEENGVINPGFEDVPPYVSNKNFEEGTIVPWSPGPQTSISIVTDAGLAFDGVHSMKVQSTVQDGGATMTVPCYPNRIYDISLRVRTVSGTGTVELAASVPGDIKVPLFSPTDPDTIVGELITGSSARPVVGTVNGELNIQYADGIDDPDDANFTGIAYVELEVDVVATTTYQQLRLLFWTGNGQTSIDISVRNRGSVFDFHADHFFIDGLGIGLDGWQVVGTGGKTHQAAMPDQAFAQSAAGAIDTGSFGLELLTRKAGQGVQQLISGIIPGGTYTMSARIKITGNARFVLTDVLGNWLPGAFDLGGSGGIFGPFSATFTLPDHLPGDGNQIRPDQAVILKIVYGDDLAAGNTELWYVDNVKLVPGKPASTMGVILTDLFEDAAIDHIADGRTTIGGAGHLAFLDYDFGAFGDSSLPSGSAWTTPANPGGKESLTIKRGISYLQFFEQEVSRLGYEWRVLFEATPSPRWLLQVYIPGGMEIDKSATVSLITGAVDSSIIGLNGGGFNVLVGEGRDKILIEQTDAAELAAYGRREKYLPNIRMTGYPSLASWVDAHAFVESGTKEGHRIQLSDTSQFIPYRDFQPGDLVEVDLGTKLSARDLNAKAVSFQLDDQKASFFVDLNTDPAPVRAAPYMALAKMLRGFRGIDDQFKWGGGASLPIVAGGVATAGTGGGGGGMMTISVAASDASQSSKDKADFVCTGIDDQVTIQLALDKLGAVGAPYGRLILSEGTFFCTGTWSTFGDFEGGIIIQGMGANATRVIFDAGTDTQCILMQDPFSELRDLQIQYLDGCNYGTAVVTFAAITGRAHNVTIFIDDANAAVDVPGHGFFWDGSPTGTPTTSAVETFDLSGAWDCSVWAEGPLPSGFIDFSTEHDGTMFVGNESHQDLTGTPSLSAHYEIQSDACLMLGNRAHGGQTGLIIGDAVTTRFRNRIIANHFEVRRWCIILTRGNGNLVEANMFSAANNQTDDTYSAILLDPQDTGISDNYIIGNLGQGGSNKFAFMVDKLASGGEDIVVGNDWRDAFAQSTPHDTSVALTETWPAGGAGQGDNFV